MLQSNIRQIEKLYDTCKTTFNKSIKPDKRENILLITFANNKKELEYSHSFLTVNFPYIIVCITNSDSDLINIDLNDYLLNSSGFTIIRLSENSNLNYKRSTCIQKAIRIGFKQQSLLLVYNVTALFFWQTNLVFESISNASKQINLNLNMSSNLIEQNLDQNIYFIRKNVANGVKIVITTESDPEFKNFCDFYSKNKENTILYNFNKAIEKLHWHSNDLASENCENIEFKYILIPDLHGGPITDIASTLVHLGQNPIIGRLYHEKLPISDALTLVKKSKYVSNFVNTYVVRNRLTEDMIKENFEFYKKSDEFQQVDLVICSFMACMCEAFIPLNKTIIFNPAQRYNIGRCDQRSWIKLNDNLFKVKAKSKLVVTAMSKYDREYLTHFTGLFKTNWY